MKDYRKTWNFLLIVVIIIQLIQPKKNISKGSGENDISKMYAIPESVHQTFTQKCYDCHSNNTRYPWYFHIQPIGWWLAAHVIEGKEHLNFSEFKTYQADEAEHKLEDVLKVVEEKTMPLKAYVFLHPHTELTAGDEKAIIDWVNTVLASKTN